MASAFVLGSDDAEKLCGDISDDSSEITDDTSSASASLPGLPLEGGVRPVIDSPSTMTRSDRKHSPGTEGCSGSAPRGRYIRKNSGLKSGSGAIESSSSESDSEMSPPRCSTAHASANVKDSPVRPCELATSIPVAENHETTDGGSPFNAKKLVNSILGDDSSSTLSDDDDVQNANAEIPAASCAQQEYRGLFAPSVQRCEDEPAEVRVVSATALPAAQVLAGTSVSEHDVTEEDDLIHATGSACTEAEWSSSLAAPAAVKTVHNSGGSDSMADCLGASPDFNAPPATNATSVVALRVQEELCTSALSLSQPTDSGLSFAPQSDAAFSATSSPDLPSEPVADVAVTQEGTPELEKAMSRLRVSATAPMINQGIVNALTSSAVREVPQEVNHDSDEKCIEAAEHGCAVELTAETLSTESKAGQAARDGTSHAASEQSRVSSLTFDPRHHLTQTARSHVRNFARDRSPSSASSSEHDFDISVVAPVDHPAKRIDTAPATTRPKSKAAPKKTSSATLGRLRALAAPSNAIAPKPSATSPPRIAMLPQPPAANSARKNVSRTRVPQKPTKLPPPKSIKTSTAVRQNEHVAETSGIWIGGTLSTAPVEGASMNLSVSRRSAAPSPPPQSSSPISLAFQSDLAVTPEPSPVPGSPLSPAKENTPSRLARGTLNSFTPVVNTSALDPEVDLFLKSLPGPPAPTGGNGSGASTTHSVELPPYVANLAEDFVSALKDRAQRTATHKFSLPPTPNITMAKPPQNLKHRVRDEQEQDTIEKMEYSIEEGRIPEFCLSTELTDTATLQALQSVLIPDHTLQHELKQDDKENVQPGHEQQKEVNMSEHHSQSKLEDEHIVPEELPLAPLKGTGGMSCSSSSSSKGMGEPFQNTRSRLSECTQLPESMSSRSSSNVGSAAMEASHQFNGQSRGSSRSHGFVPTATPHPPPTVRPFTAQLPSPVCVAAIASTRQHLLHLRSQVSSLSACNTSLEEMTSKLPEYSNLNADGGSRRASVPKLNSKSDGIALADDMRRQDAVSSTSALAQAHAKAMQEAADQIAACRDGRSVSLQTGLDNLDANADAFSKVHAWIEEADAARGKQSKRQQHERQPVSRALPQSGEWGSNADATVAHKDATSQNKFPNFNLVSSFAAGARLGTADSGKAMPARLPLPPSLGTVDVAMPHVRL